MKLMNGKELKYTFSSDSIFIPKSNYYFEKNIVMGEIKSITIDNTFTIKTGDKFPVKMKFESIYKTEYVVNKILENEHHFILTEFIYNKFNYLLLPAIIRNIAQINSIANSPHFLNCYTNTTHVEWYDKEYVLYLAYRFTPHEAFNNLDAYLSKLSNFVGKFDDNNIRVYCLEVLKINKTDFNKIIVNDFSISDAYLKKVLSISGLTKQELAMEVANFKINVKTSIRQKIALEYNVDISDVPEDVDNQALKFISDNLLYKLRD